jgi:hypothetical protein
MSNREKLLKEIDGMSEEQLEIALICIVNIKNYNYPDEQELKDSFEKITQKYDKLFRELEK